ncbi:hypothetical protein [Brachyspira catarrhinii]|uniref:Uncharacterized protein n=1 Tax=Brachyspira catarrhinii TaxID=2528966 RepID=A0ABY2TS62_9SPIR|nr:hypothetical protein [Brachyspira catarrhinii]TKZ35413.1 hypothetical protein EZH24_05435 [Brachyspira catarrhinii]
MRFNKIGQTILLALSLTAIIVAMSCSGADATKPEDLKPDLGKELGSGRRTASNLTLITTNDTKYVLVAGGTGNFFSGSFGISGYTNGAGITVTGISKVTYDNAGTNTDITGIATPVYNDAGGVYRVNFNTTDANITAVNIEYSYKLKLAPAQAPKTTHTKIGVNTNTTVLDNLDLYAEIEGSSEGSLFGKTYVIGATADISSSPTSFSNGLITNNILTNLSIPTNGMYKLWIY